MENLDYNMGFFSFTLVYSALMDFISANSLDASVLISRFQTDFFHVLEGSCYPTFFMEAHE